jgi:hypothetical protein
MRVHKLTFQEVQFSAWHQSGSRRNTIDHFVMAITERLQGYRLGS